MSFITASRESPPVELRQLFKKYQKLNPEDIAKDSLLLDLEPSLLPKHRESFVFQHSFPGDQIREVVSRFQDPSSASPDSWQDRSSYTFGNLPGLIIVPSLLPPLCQRNVLSKLLHRDLSDSRHKTNVHLHHYLPYPTSFLPVADAINSKQNSFFSHETEGDLTFSPKSPEIHRPFGISQFLNKKLRWITLGGQYDWTRKVYPEGEPPDFPPDIANLVQGLFPDMIPEAAIVNLYSPGDTLSLHRDVSEHCDRGLVSISLGCDAIFIIGLDSHRSKDDGKDPGPIENKVDESQYLVIRLRSGDAVYMSGAARYAWHGVPKIIPGTCPSGLEDWPATPETDSVKNTEFEHWRGWMVNKRINLNVRQIHER